MLKFLENTKKNWPLILVIISITVFSISVNESESVLDSSFVSIIWDKFEYSVNDEGKLTVIVNNYTKSELEVNVSSLRFPQGVNMTLIETQKSSGIFKGSIIFVDEKLNKNKELEVWKNGDTITAEYSGIKTKVTIKGMQITTPGIQTPNENKGTEYPQPTDPRIKNRGDGKETEYQQLTNPIYPPVSPPSFENYDEIKFPIKISLAEEDSVLKQFTISDDPQEFALTHGLEYKDGEVRVLIIFDQVSDLILDEIKKLATVESSNENMIQATVPLKNLIEINNVPDLIKVQPISKALQTSITSEGLEFIKAQSAQSAGLSGKNVKIAILDLAFDADNSEIKSNIVEQKSFRHDFQGDMIPLSGFGSEAVHGTSVAEIVTDIAQNSELYLLSFASEMEFLDAMDYAMKQNVDMITMSAGWVNYPTDGASEMVQKVEQAINSGIPFVVSAGNYAETHWEGKFVDSNENGWHEFAESDEGLTVVASDSRVERKKPFVLYLTWDSPSHQVYDFDLTMTDESGKQVAFSSNLQKTIGDIYFEYVYFTPNVPGNYSLGISFKGKTTDAVLEVFSPSDRLEYPVSEGSVSVPTDAQGIISVGALNHATFSLERFSSHGPTNHCLQVPTLVGPDAVTTLAYKDHPFYGTSAAAPHVAGIVALMLGQKPDLTPSDIFAALTQNSNKDLSAYNGTDNIYGFGAATSEFLAGIYEINTTYEKPNGCFIGTQGGQREEQVIVQQSYQSEIPQWVKSNAEWWANGLIDNSSFVEGIQWMIKEGTMKIPPSTQENVSVGNQIPDWIKNNAGWWAEGLIDDNSFVEGIQWMIKTGIMKI